MAVSSGRPSWASFYARRLLGTDIAAIAIAVFGSQLLWFGLDNARLVADWRFTISYPVVSLVFGSAWLIALKYYGTRDHKIIGIGPTEYKLIADATIRIFGLLGIVAFLLQLSPARGYFLTAFPVGLLLLLAGRWGWRQWLVSRRREGRFGSRAVLVGSRSKSEHVAEMISRYPASGYFVAGMVFPGGVAGDEVLGVPVLGGIDEIVDALDRSGADAIVLTGSDDLPHRAVKRLSWEIEKRGIELIVVPALTEVAGPRIHTTPIVGLPLIHVAFPEFDGPRYATKRIADVMASTFALVVLSPLFLAIAIAVKATSPGPVFFRQQRIGLNGAEFDMLKFRSMHRDAEQQLDGLLDVSDGNGVLFKKRKDPRVTKVGAVLRRWSIDELPQLINVLRGEMAFVGPRPPLAREVEQYDDHARRRLLVKPGITGLWQISGRSDLSWDDSVRLDLYYVENWSLTGDIIIIYRTIRAVIAGRGAY